MRKALRSDDDRKQETWLETADSRQEDSQRGDPERRRSVELGQRPRRGPERETETRLRPLGYGSRGGGENNDSILETSCCVPAQDSGHTSLYVHDRTQPKARTKAKQARQSKAKQSKASKTKAETRTEHSPLPARSTFRDFLHLRCTTDKNGNPARDNCGKRHTTAENKEQRQTARNNDRQQGTTTDNALLGLSPKEVFPL